MCTLQIILNHLIRCGDCPLSACGRCGCFWVAHRGRPVCDVQDEVHLRIPGTAFCHCSFTMLFWENDDHWLVTLRRRTCSEECDWGVDHEAKLVVPLVSCCWFCPLLQIFFQIFQYWMSHYLLEPCCSLYCRSSNTQNMFRPRFYKTVSLLWAINTNGVLV